MLKVEEDVVDDVALGLVLPAPVLVPGGHGGGLRARLPPGPPLPEVDGVGVERRQVALHPRQELGAGEPDLAQGQIYQFQLVSIEGMAWDTSFPPLCRPD